MLLANTVGSVICCQVCPEFTDKKRASVHVVVLMNLPNNLVASFDMAIGIILSPGKEYSVQPVVPALMILRILVGVGP